MATLLRRAVAFGPAGCIWPGSPQDVRYGNNRAWLRDSGTKVVRLWADWPSLEPAAGQPDAGRWDALDQQIAAANADGLKIILTPYRFPTWANGTAAMTSEQLAATMVDRKFPNDPETKAKSLLFRYPGDLSPTGPWGRFIAKLLSRYAGKLAAFEVCNEPNHQWWPQQNAAGTIVVHEAVAQMFVSAKKIAAGIPGATMLCGPGSADGVDSNRMRTGYHSFAERLLTRLPQLGFTAGARFAWTHHNYTDVANDTGSRTADMRRRLIGRWAGYPYGDAQRPDVWITEGGVTLSKVASTYGITDATAKRAKQAELVKRNWDRMYTGAEGAGVTVTTQYLLHTDPAYDSGLCETPEAGGATRPVYATWKALPSMV